MSTDRPAGAGEQGREGEGLGDKVRRFLGGDEGPRDEQRMPHDDPDRQQDDRGFTPAQPTTGGRGDPGPDPYAQPSGPGASRGHDGPGGPGAHGAPGESGAPGEPGRPGRPGRPGTPGGDGAPDAAGQPGAYGAADQRASDASRHFDGPGASAGPGGPGREDQRRDPGSHRAPLDYADTPPGQQDVGAPPPPVHGGGADHRSETEHGDGGRSEPTTVMQAGSSEPGHRPDPEQAGLLRDSDGLRSQWQQVQTTFVDDPQRAVREAGVLVDRTLEEIRTNLGSHGDQATTEDLRLAFQRYREFFHRLLSA